jgi:hypothetical protein
LIWQFEFVNILGKTASIFDLLQCHRILQTLVIDYHIRYADIPHLHEKSALAVLICFSERDLEVS